MILLIFNRSVHLGFCSSISDFNFIIFAMSKIHGFSQTFPINFNFIFSIDLREYILFLSLKLKKKILVHYKICKEQQF